MSEADFESFMERQSNRTKALHSYEGFVQSRLQMFPDTPAAQMHDWLKEQYGNIEASPRTVFNFVAWVRQKYHLPKIKEPRVYEMVNELPYGKQAQVDFGSYNMRNNVGKRIKVFFFTCVLSRSRQKYIWFRDTPFTSELAIKAHEHAFAFFEGVPAEIVYDQDRVFISDENKGEIILTDGFKAYTRERSFALHFCRKADPESKGKVENVVKYVKQNFLYNRPFEDLETLNTSALAWLGRTANAMPHGVTQKSPTAEWVIEKPFLAPFTAYRLQPEKLNYNLRKDNTISWKSNFYSVPLGTYKGRGSKVMVSKEDAHLVITDITGKEICRHVIAAGKGRKIKNSDHGRDKSGGITTLIEQVSGLLDNPELGLSFFNAIRIDKPRYVRDQIIVVRQCIEQNEKQFINLALEYCCRNNINSALDFKEIICYYSRNKMLEKQQSTTFINPLSGSPNAAILCEPATSNINDYETLLNQS
jgi:hypothetical protein